MFIRFDRAESKWHKINNTYGVSRLITFNSILKSIPTTFVDSLMKRYDLSGKLLPIKKLKKGDHVTVLRDLLQIFIATVEKYEADQRIWILMDLMGRKTKIQTPSDNLTQYRLIYLLKFNYSASITSWIEFMPAPSILTNVFYVSFWFPAHYL